MTARNLSLEAVNADWQMPLDGMKNSPAFTALPKVDGQPVSVEEFKDWKFKQRSPTNLRILREIDRDNPAVDLFARPSFPLGFTPVGQQNIELEATSPFGETVTLPVTLNIGDIPFWKKWGWWLIGLLILQYQRFRKRPKLLERNPRPDEEMSYLFKDHLTFGSRWMPYKNQTAIIDSLSFEAKGSKSIMLTTVPEDFMLNSELIGNKKVIVRPNAEISREIGRGKEGYTYRS